MGECGAQVEWWHGKTEVLRQNPVPVMPIFPQQIYDGHAWEWSEGYRMIDVKNRLSYGMASQHIFSADWN